jgi:hypothetical protein
VHDVENKKKPAGPSERFGIRSKDTQVGLPWHHVLATAMVMSVCSPSSLRLEHAVSGVMVQVTGAGAGVEAMAVTTAIQAISFSITKRPLSKQRVKAKDAFF